MRLQQTAGLTLTELLVTTAIVGIMLIGVMSGDYALRSAEQTTSRRQLVYLRTASMLEDMTKNLSLATGGLYDPNGPGITTANLAANNNNYICVRQDLATNGNPLNTPADTTDDRYVCYTRRTNNLMRCVYRFNQGPGNCNNGDMFLGTVTTDVWSTPLTPMLCPPAGTCTAANYYFQFSLKNRWAPAQAADRLTNPEVILTSRIQPSF